MFQRNMQTRHCICYESPRLLQRASGEPSAVNHRATATNPERRCTIGERAPTSRSRDFTSTRAPLASNTVPRYFQDVSDGLLMHNAHVGRSQRHIIYTLSPIANMPNRGRLRSSSKYELPAMPLKIGERAFSYSRLAFWNSLPSKLTSIIDTKTFKLRLKTNISRLAYDC